MVLTFSGMPKRKQFHTKNSYKRVRKNDSPISSLSSPVSSLTSLSSSLSSPATSSSTKYINTVSSNATDENDSCECDSPILQSVSDEDIDNLCFKPLRASSPEKRHSDNELNSVRSTDTDLSQSVCDDFLYNGSNVTLSYFSSRLSAISTKHALSDAATGDILEFIGDILPLPNVCPTLHKHKRDLSVPESPVEVYDSVNGEVFVLPFAEQVELILSKYPNCDLSPSSDSSTFSDIQSGNRFPAIQPNTLYFILNTDGFSPILSRKVQVWPLLLSLVNLPPFERNKLCNIIMVAFYIGKSKPQWSTFLNHVVGVEKVKIGNKKLSCKIVSLVADAPAKSSCCYTQQTNAR